MKIAIIMVNFHAQKLILKCLESLSKHLTLPYQVYLADNSLEPDTSDIEQAFPDVLVLRTGVNGGFAAGCNLGLKQAFQDKMDFYLLLNPDTYIEEDFLSPLIDVFKQAPEYGIVGPKILSAGSNKVWEAGSEMVWWKGGPKHIYDDRFDSVDKVACVPFVSGCVMLIKKELLEEVGFLDERYFLYFEDTDYAQAAQRQDYLVGYVPKSIVFHEESSTTGYQSPDFIYYFSRNRIWFMRKWASRKNYLFFSLYNFLVKVPGSFVVFTLLRFKPKLTLAFLRGVRDGFLKNVQ